MVHTRNSHFKGHAYTIYQVKQTLNQKSVKINKEGHSLYDDKGIKVGKHDLMGKGACLQA